MGDLTVIEGKFEQDGVQEELDLNPLACTACGFPMFNVLITVQDEVAVPIARCTGCGEHLVVSSDPADYFDLED